MHRISDLSPCLDLLGVVDAGSICIAAGAGGNEGRFRDQESARNGGALGIVFCSKGCGDVS